MSNSSLAIRDSFAPSIEEKREAKKALEQNLARSLAAYVALRSDEPMSVVLDDLFGLEMKAAQFLGVALPAMASQDLTGALASVMQFIPLSTNGIPRPERDVTPEQLTGEVAPRKRERLKKPENKRTKRTKKKGRALKDDP